MPEEEELLSEGVEGPLPLRSLISSGASRDSEEPDASVETSCSGAPFSTPGGSEPLPEEEELLSEGVEGPFPAVEGPLPLRASIAFVSLVRWLMFVGRDSTVMKMLKASKAV